MKNPLLCLANIFLQAPNKESPILNNLSLEVFPGEFIVLVGSNGCGKSSLLRVINGLLHPNSGTLQLEGKNLLSKSLNERSRSIVTLTQDLNLSTFSDLTILENCQIALHRNKKTSFSFSSKKEEKQIKEHLSAYNPSLSEKLHLPVSNLSGGERQTLGLAMNLWLTPSLLLLDEHTSALDPHMAKKLMKLTSETVIEKKITTLVVTHNLEDALQYGTRLIAMNKGRIIANFPYEEKRKLTHEKLYSLYSTPFS